MLQRYIIDHIKQQKSGSKTNTAKKKVDALFGKMKLSCTKANGDVVYFTHGQALAKAIVHAIKHHCSGVLKNSFKLQFFLSKNLSISYLYGR